MIKIISLISSDQFYCISVNPDNFDLRPAIDIFHAANHVGSLYIKLPREVIFPEIKSPEIHSTKIKLWERNINRILIRKRKITQLSGILIYSYSFTRYKLQ